LRRSCVVESSCEEGAGAPSALGQAPAVHGATSAGWSIRGAAREVGISRSAAANWTRGYTVYRDGVAVRFVEPLDRLEVREISARYLSQQERIEIADLHHEGVGVREISRRVGRSPSTISRELRRNRSGGPLPGYCPFEAHRRACARRARRRERRIETNHDLGRVVAELLGQRWSPEQISPAAAQALPRRTGDVAVA
jgi:IS30 family transposase